jgi:hypothetical protein
MIAALERRGTLFPHNLLAGTAYLGYHTTDEDTGIACTLAARDPLIDPRGKCAALMLDSTSAQSASCSHYHNHKESLSPPFPGANHESGGRTASAECSTKKCVEAPQNYLAWKPPALEAPEGKGRMLCCSTTSRSRSRSDDIQSHVRYWGKEVTLQTGRFVKTEGGAYEFRWLPFTYEKLTAGKWTVTVEWSSAENGWEDSETHAMGLIDDIWIGKVTSNSLAVSLPSASKNGSKAPKK